MSQRKLHPDLDLLPEVFRAYPGVEAVYRFGSVAEGRAYAESDLDLAIVPRDARVRTQRLDILTDLARRGFCNVDLVFLDTHDITLKYEAVRPTDSSTKSRHLTTAATTPKLGGAVHYSREKEARR
ncbi:MAG: nucleotidyltransferase domain-containing protein [Wenzhouxiangella sp.]|jgi:predicted nucleotidyltransferase|nr:nucleotidyltransferase domain-containing protein [Wenzhouxiangella sp.]